jgi:hypothetical protein
MRAWCAWHSTNPLSHRSGSGTLRSITAPCSVASSISPRPTLRRTASPSATPASAARMAGLKSTFVVP